MSIRSSYQRLRKAATSASCLILLAAAPVAQAQQITYNIPSEPLSQALRDYGRESDRQIVFTEGLVRGRTSHEVKGIFTSDAALTVLLKGTGLIARSRPSGAIMIERPATKPHYDSTSFPDPQKQSISAAPTASVAPAALGEVIVSAQKQGQQLLRNVPIPMTVVDARNLIENNDVTIKQYYNKIPGLIATPDDTDVGSGMQLAIRGVTTGAYTNPTVGVVIDGVPYGASTALGGGVAAPDIDPWDLKRIEVLRGPQGTLYGASSMGGLLQFVTVDPSTAALSGHVQMDTDSTQNSGALGYGIRAGINVPLSRSLAVRLSAFHREDPGYIDNTVTKTNDVNRTVTSGGFLSALWLPYAGASLKIDALYQDTTADGASLVNPELGALQQNVVANGGGYTKHVQVYDAIFKTNVGHGELTSLTGYSVNSFTGHLDLTQELGPFTRQLFGVTGTPGSAINSTRKISQEVRYFVLLSKSIDWLVGGFYTHENTQFFANLLATVPQTGQIVGVWESSDRWPTSYDERAMYTDVTVHINPRFDVQLGGRESDIRQTYSETITGTDYTTYLLGLSSPVINPEYDTNANAFTYLVTPQFHLSPQMMLYARFASGYRAGGPNPLHSVFSLPPRYKPDHTADYEFGLKGNVFHHALGIDLSVYYIDWKDIQIQVTDPRSAQIYFVNGSRAKSEGVELELDGRPLKGLTISGWGSLDNAKLTQGFPPDSAATGVAGDRLPYVSRLSAHASAEWSVPLTASVTASLGSEVSYVGNRLGVFTQSGQRQHYPSYVQVNIFSSLLCGSWTATLSANNLTDRRGVIGGGVGSFTPEYFTYIRPRTYTLSVSKSF